MSAEEARARLRELTDFAAPWAVWIAATLRLADHVEEGATSVGLEIRSSKPLSTGNSLLDLRPSSPTSLPSGGHA